MSQIQIEPNTFKTKCVCGEALADLNQFICSSCSKKLYCELSDEERLGVEFVQIDQFTRVKRLLKSTGGLEK